MQESVVFIAVVLCFGWFFSYLLSRETRRSGTFFSKTGVCYSLAAVTTPTIMAFILSGPLGRTQLFAQFRPKSSAIWIALSIGLPLLTVLAGHIAGSISSPSKMSILPKRNNVKAAVGFLPLALLWGLLEEIGWRGFLAENLSRQMPELAVSLLVGIVWGLWHAPQIFTNDVLKKAFRGRVALGATLWIAQCLALSCIFGWLQFRTGSFLYPTLAHALVNTFEKASRGSVGDNDAEVDLMWAGNTGIPAICITTIMAVIVFACF